MDMAAIKKQLEELNKKGKGGDWWSPKDAGTYKVRILPELDGQATFAKEWDWHFGVGEKGNNFLCLEQFGCDCSICDLVDDLYKTEVAELLKLAKDWKRKAKAYFNIVERAHVEKGVQLASVPASVLKQILAIFVNPDFGNITDVNGGRDVSITRGATVSFDMYSVMPGANASPLGTPEQIAAWMPKRTDVFGQFKRDEKAEQDMLKLVVELRRRILPGGTGMGSALSKPPPPPQATQAIAPPPAAAPVAVSAPPAATPVAPPLPVPAPAPVAAPQPPAPPPPQPEPKFWFNNNGSVAIVTKAAVQLAIDGKTVVATATVFMSEDQKSGWRSALDLGFRAPVEAPVPPAAPPQGNVPPPAQPVPAAPKRQRKAAAPVAPVPPTPAAPLAAPAPAPAAPVGFNVPLPVTTGTRLPIVFPLGLDEEKKACFGHPASEGGNNPELERCLICTFDFQCQNEIARTIPKAA